MEDYRDCADQYLFTLAAAFGLIRKLSEPQGLYRIHGNNNYESKSIEEKSKHFLRVYEHRCEVLSKVLSKMGIIAKGDIWKKKPHYLWAKSLFLSAQDIAREIPEGEKYLLVDQNEWENKEVVTGRYRLPFLEHDGKYWGAPQDDAEAILELERMRQLGTGFIVFAWNAFWWLEYYSEFHHYLRSRYSCCLKNNRIVVFDLRD